MNSRFYPWSVKTQRNGEVFVFIHISSHGGRGGFGKLGHRLGFSARWIWKFFEEWLRKVWLTGLKLADHVWPACYDAAMTNQKVAVKNRVWYSVPSELSSQTWCCQLQWVSIKSFQRNLLSLLSNGSALQVSGHNPFCELWKMQDQI